VGSVRVYHEEKTLAWSAVPIVVELQTYSMLGISSINVSSLVLHLPRLRALNHADLAIPSLVVHATHTYATNPTCSSHEQAGTLSNLLSLSDQLPKIDSSFTGVVSKLLDTLRSLVDDQSKVGQYARVNDISAEDYLIPGDSRGWTWDAGRWGSGGKVADVVDALQKVSHPRLHSCYTTI